jgi:hypothetical protein
MTINQDIPEERLLEDLLSQEDGDEMTNRVRQLIQQRFDVSFAKFPYNLGPNSALHDQACVEQADKMIQDLSPFVVGNVPADGAMVIQLCGEVILK